MNKCKSFKEPWIVMSKVVCLRKLLILPKMLNPDLLQVYKKDGEIILSQSNKLRLLFITISKLKKFLKLSKHQLLLETGTRPSNYWPIKHLKSQDLIIDKSLNIIPLSDNMILLKSIIWKLHYQLTLSKCMPKQESGNKPLELLKKISHKEKLPTYTLNKPKSFKRKKNLNKLKKCTLLLKNMTLLSLCTRSVDNMTIWSDLFPNTEATFSKILTLMLPKNFTNKVTSNLLNNIIFQVEHGEMLLRCIRVKTCGNKLSDVQNFMEKMSTHVSLPRDGLKLWVLNKAWRCSLKWT